VSEQQGIGNVIEELRELFKDQPPTPPTDHFLARPPFKVIDGRWHCSTGARVIVCFEDLFDCGRLYDEDIVDSDPWFICPCGRLGQRMTKATDRHILGRDP
jgi:hypothetical protein